MQTLPVVELDITRQSRACVAHMLIFGAIHLFDLERFEEALGDGVVIRITDPAHAAADAVRSIRAACRRLQRRPPRELPLRWKTGPRRFAAESFRNPEKRKRSMPEPDQRARRSCCIPSL